MRIVTTLKSATRRPRRGAAAVEFALILPVLMLLVLGAVDFGRFAYNYIAVTNAARAGASHGIMNSYSPTGRAAWEGAILAAAREEMNQQTGYEAGGLTVQVVTPTPDANGLRRVEVTVRHPFRMITTWPLLPSSVTLQRRVVLRSIR